MPNQISRPCPICLWREEAIVRQPQEPLNGPESTGEGTVTPAGLDAAETRVAEVLRAQAHDDFDHEARAVVAAVRPVIYREAAGRLRIWADGMPTERADDMVRPAATLEAGDWLEFAAIDRTSVDREEAP